MTKKELRRQYLLRRAELSPKSVLVNNDLLLIRFQQYASGNLQTLLSYWPMEERGEVNTHLFADYLLFRMPGLQLAFPVMDMRTAAMLPYPVDDDTEFVVNAYGIMEPVGTEALSPVDIDAVFVPLLAFDVRGYRVGYGKGFYDRFLAGCRPDVLKIGFSFFEAEAQIDDVNEFDVPLNVCFTPNTTYEF